jgi:hypothetical protein
MQLLCPAAEAWAIIGILKIILALLRTPWAVVASVPSALARLPDDVERLLVAARKPR